MKKFINDYWWLIAIAVFLWWRKSHKETPATIQPKTGLTGLFFSPENAQAFAGKKVKLHIGKPPKMQPGANWDYSLIFNKENDPYGQTHIYNGETIEISRVKVRTPEERNIGLCGGSGYTDYEYTIYLPDGRFTSFADNWSSFLSFEIVD